jgi:hypothetical protein
VSIPTSLNTNPNAKGGSFNYDSRTGLGYGQTKNGGLGSTWNMGDALSSPKGEWDYDESDVNDIEEEAFIVRPETTLRDLAIAAGLVKSYDKLDNDSDEDITDVDVRLNNKAIMSFNRQPVDSLKHRSNDPYSFNGLANTSAYLGASHYRSGSVVLECLYDYIKQAVLLEDAAGISGQIHVAKAAKGNNLGGKNRHYHKPNAIGSMGKTGAGYIKHDGYTQSHNATTDGGETTSELYFDIEVDWVEGEDVTTSDWIYRTSGEHDKANVAKHSKNIKNITSM